MAKKKIITEANIIDLYMDYVLENNKKPMSVYGFCKSNNIEETSFHKHFGSFESIEKQIFKIFFDNTISVLERDDSYNSFDSRNKLLSFYYTFFELLTANRSYVVYALNENKLNLKHLKQLTLLRTGFIEFIKSLNIETLETKQKNIDKFQQKALEESAWMQLLLTLKFWIDDGSAGFEKTDIFIEKSVNTSFDLINMAPIKSVIDFGKFLFKEKMSTI